MQINRKLLSTAVTALLLVSMLAAAAPAYAAPSISTPSGSASVDDYLPIVGIGAVAHAQVELFWMNTNPANLLNTTYAASDGSFEIYFKVPLAEAGIYDVVVRDSSGATDYITLTIDSKITVSDKVALPGDQITVSGTGFAPDTAIDIDFGGVAVAPTGLTTNASGAFSAVITIPSNTTISTTAYTLTATDGTDPATETITVNYYVKVIPDSATYQPGMTVEVSGRIEPNLAVTVTFGGTAYSTEDAFSTTSDSRGYFSGTYKLPAVLSLGGSYTFTAMWTSDNVDKTATATIQISSGAPQIDFKKDGVSVTVVRPGTLLEISGQHFTSETTVVITMLGTTLNTTTVEKNGQFVCEITVPDVTPDSYTVTVTDEYSVTATKTLTIRTAVMTEITPRSSSYAQGDTISFNIRTTDDNFRDVSVALFDPSGNQWWAITGWGVTTQADGFAIVVYQEQVDANNNRIVLPADAPIGTWNWTITYLSDAFPAPNGGRATGLFEVGAGGTSGIIDAINELTGTITDIQDDIVTIKTSVGTSVTTTLSAIQGKVTSIENSIATLSIPDIGTITASLDDIDAVLGVVAGDTTTLKTSIGDITTSLSAINAVVCSVEDNVVTIKTDVGTIQGTVTEVKDGVATITTSIGNVQTSVSNLQPDVKAANDNTANMSSMIYVAVAFAIIAAIAAVASILLMRKKIAS